MQTPEENPEQLKPEDDFPVSEQPDEPTAAEPGKKIPVNGESRSSSLSDEAQASESNGWKRFKNWYRTDKKKSIPLSILALLILIIIIPWSRYHTTGLFLKKNFNVRVLDSTAHIPVSGATVSVGSISTVTDGNGKAVLHGVKVGSHRFEVNKKYYQDKSASITVPIFSQKKVSSLPLVATGRQVKIVVTDFINHQKLGNVKIKLADIEAKTDKNGTALVVLPVGTKSQKATLTLKGYNDTQQTITVSDSAVKENDLKMTPVGKIYFLSKRAGKLDVMKANLDGSSPEVVVAATGNEQDSNTSLSQSADGKYVALISKRNAANPSPQLYALTTEDDRLLQTDSANADFFMIGWAGDALIYLVQRKDLQPWQSGREKLKSYDATTGKTTLLDQTTASGDSTGWVEETYSAQIIIVNNTIVYGKRWNPSSAPDLLDGKNASLQTISSDGSNHRTITNLELATQTIQLSQHSPNSVYVSQTSRTDKDAPFLDYTIGSATTNQTLGVSQEFSHFPIFYYSPSGKQALWSKWQDDHLSIVTADSTGNKQKNLPNLTKYIPYGWHTEQYLLLSLVSMNSRELYITGSAGGIPIKITDYWTTPLN